MRIVKSLLLGSAAGLVAVAGAQAADLPVKAKPVEYVKICNLYGDGFYYLPGTETCVKIGSLVQADYYWNSTGGSQQLYFANGAGNSGGAQDRTTSSFATRARVDVGIDSRSQTSYGTLRTFSQIRMDNVDQGTSNSNMVRGFLQFAGFTFGRARSLTDPYGRPGGGGFLMLHQFQEASDTGGGINTLNYTWEVANGITLSAGFDERRVKPLVNLNQSTALAANFETVTVSVGFAPNSNRAGEYIPNPWVTLRVSQAWGTASIAFIGNYNQGNYYGGLNGIAAGSEAAISVPGQVIPACAGVISSSFTNPNTLLTAQQTVGGNVTIGGTSLCNHPSDKWGYAVTSGLMLNAETFLPGFASPGDRFGAIFQYGVGASAYGGGNAISSAALFGGGNNVALGFVTDAVYCTPASQANAATANIANNCTGNLELTTAWAAGAGYEHYWSSSLSTKIYGAYSQHLYNANVVNGGWLCGNIGSGIPLGTGATTNAQPNAVSSGVVTAGGGTGRCNPSSSLSQVAGQINWFPVPSLRIAFEVALLQVGSAFAGQQVSLGRIANGSLGVLGARPSGTYTARDESIVSAELRIQRAFGGVAPE